GEKSKKLYIYDSFEGLPEKREEDNSVLGEEFKKGELGVTKREVKERFLRAGLKVPVMKKGWFSELSVGDMPEKIAFSFLDGDFYESIKDSLKLVENLMVPGGIILVHDYNNPALPGVKKAVEEWKTGKNLEIDVFESIAVIKYKKIV
ncbi:MAG: TylF/MycF/NovP-related O-methyltransferase, partial [Candidatus Saccharibacteria bacterium]|nr:TylF/MycF/NovP-related O-methyltransferase [Candidatus Saccharibacteria bacterium]